MQSPPFPSSEAVRGIAIAVVLTIVTCGIYGLFWQYKQMKTLNAWLGREEFSFVNWILLSIVTCGIFALYYEYKMAKAINEIQNSRDDLVASDLALICLLLAIFVTPIASIAIQQAEINKLYNVTADI